ncbi:serine/threonine protein kinase [Cystobacter fuscus]|uniref:serine/threonine protein kinase n=1 Tax=Cystobacter fuscus TaxID=43 RepID=UPI002B305236|nr:serine/threonine protein kinase [Cystobacter fuscus]
MHEDSSASWGEPLGLALEPGTQVAGYTLEAILATGGSGTVYLARRGHQRVALKLVPRDAWGEREVDALRRVRHPQVVSLLGYGLWPEQRPHFLVLTLELVEGLALDVWAHEHNPSARQLVRQVLLPLTRALAQVHAVGVVHRDIKESNVVMRAADGLPVLVDFGSARCEGAPRLTERMPPGTREYRSPEMLRFSREWDGGHYPATPSDDLWALGVTLYWLLTRELPFGDRGGPLAQRILEQAPRPVHDVNPRVPRALGDVCLRMLEKEPSARYPTPEALAEALVEALARADDTWDVPLQPAPPQPLAPSPRPPEPPTPVTSVRAPPEREAVARRGQPGAWLVVLLGVLGVLFWSRNSPPTPRVESLAPLPPSQGTQRQELALATPTGEVGHSAGPSKSSTPALVAQATLREDPPMLKSPKSRAPLAAMAGLAACVGLGCASAPRPVVDPPPPPIPCPAGAAQTYKAYRTRRSTDVLFEVAADRTVIMHNNAPLRVQLIEKWGDIPEDTPLLGRTWFGKDRVYGRFTEAILPSGERLPICLDLDFNGPGVPMRPGSTRTVARLNTISAGADVAPESMDNQ